MEISLKYNKLQEIWENVQTKLYKLHVWNGWEYRTSLKEKFS